MPFGSEGVQDGVGLALSGGGFRATLFHLGTLWRLNELGLLGRLDRISSVSGGSITAGLLGLAWDDLSFDSTGKASNFHDAVVTPLRRFCRQSIDAPAIAEGAFSPWKCIGDLIIEQYREHLFGDKTLADLPEKPRFVINATNLQTGVAFRFSRPYIGDYLIGLCKAPQTLLATAVAASSAFPPVLSPVQIKDPGVFEFCKGADLNGNPAYTSALWLTDGGVYDNMGLETVWNRYSTVLVSDAGAPSKPVEDVETAWHKQVLGALNIAIAQSRALRKRALVADFKAGVRRGSYWGLTTHIDAYGLKGCLPVSQEIAKSIAGIRTRLNPFSDVEQGRLINFGYALTDAALRSHCDHLLTHCAASALEPAWPVKEYPLG